MFIIFDLDGTLANIEHRLHFIQRPNREKDWDAFHKACTQDKVISPLVQICKDLIYVGHTIEVWSGRSDKVRAETQHWLACHGVFPSQLLMRMEGDYTPDHELKEMWLMHAIGSGQTPDLVFDDRSRLVEMWRRNGIQCCQVAPGDF